MPPSRRLDPSVAGNPFGFAGEYVDSTTGLYDLRARQSDPTTGRFLATGPLGPLQAGVNLYAYVGDSPIGYIDSSGLRRTPATSDRLSFCGVAGWFSVFVALGCNPHVQQVVMHTVPRFVRRHYEQIVEFGGGCLAGAWVGSWYGAVVPILGVATPVAGGVAGCVAGGTLGLYEGEQAIPDRP